MAVEEELGGVAGWESTVPLPPFLVEALPEGPAEASLPPSPPPSLLLLEPPLPSLLPFTAAVFEM